MILQQQSNPYRSDSKKFKTPSQFNQMISPLSQKCYSLKTAPHKLNNCFLLDYHHSPNIPYPFHSTVSLVYIYLLSILFSRRLSGLFFEELAQPPPSGAHCPSNLTFLFFSILANSTPQPVLISYIFLTDFDILIIGSSYCLLCE